MTRYEYKVVPAPGKGEKSKGVKGPEARFAHALERAMNEMATQGWEYQRAETLPSEERAGLTSSQTVWRNVLVFRRALDADIAVPPPAPAPASVEGTARPEPESDTEEQEANRFPAEPVTMPPASERARFSGTAIPAQTDGDNGVEEADDLARPSRVLTDRAVRMRDGSAT